MRAAVPGRTFAAVRLLILPIQDEAFRGFFVKSQIFSRARIELYGESCPNGSGFVHLGEKG